MATDNENGDRLDGQTGGGDASGPQGGTKPRSDDTAPARFMSDSMQETAWIVSNINDSSKAARGLYGIFLFIMATMFVLSAGITHEVLFRASPINIPLFELSIGIDVNLFSFVAPLLVFLFHAAVLHRLVDLRNKILDARETIGESADKIFRQHLHGVDFVLYAGQLERTGGQRFVTAMTILFAYVLSPMALLLFIQFQYLPYHSVAITVTHAVIITLDIIAVWFFFFWIYPSDRRPQLTAPGRLMSLLVATAMIPVTWFILVPSDEMTDQGFADGVWARLDKQFGLSRDLVLPHSNLWDSPPSPERMAAYEQTKDYEPGSDREAELRFSKEVEFRAQSLGSGAYDSTREGRDFRNANFQFSAFRRAVLENANFSKALLHFTDFTRATLPVTCFTNADAAGAVFDSANLEDASFVPAGGVTCAQGRSDGICGPANTTLSRASFKSARLSTADFSQVVASGADFTNAEAVFTNFKGASLHRAKFEGVNAGSSNFTGAILPGALFNRAGLPMANFSRAMLLGARFKGANLEGACFAAGNGCGEAVDTGIDDPSTTRCTRGYGPADAFPRQEQMALDLSDTDFECANLTNATIGSPGTPAKLNGASFQKACLVGTTFAGIDGTVLEKLRDDGAFSGACRGADLTVEALSGLPECTRIKHPHCFSQSDEERQRTVLTACFASRTAGVATPASQERSRPWTTLAPPLQ